MKIIDIHTHIYPDAIARKATDSIRDFYQLDGGGMDGSVQMLRERGAQAGISTYVVLPVSNSPKRVRHINEFLLAESQKYDDFIGFGTLHADMEGLMEETEWILQKGLKGIKMHPDSQCFAIDDPRLYPMYDFLQDKIPVMFHMGDPRYHYSHPSRLRKCQCRCAEHRILPDSQSGSRHCRGYWSHHQWDRRQYHLPDLFGR